ncbi:MAG: nucleotide sugar dehydrogenase [bacterium]
MSKSAKDELIEKIRGGCAKVAVFGLGYVGLPLAVEKAKVGLTVIGIDRQAERVEKVNRAESYIPDVIQGSLEEVVRKGKLRATTDTSVLREVDAACICVPTPLNKNKEPDISYIINVTEKIAEHLHRGELVVLESTTYPGTTEEVILPRLEESGLKVGEDFFLAFSPERVDPGNKLYKTHNTPKVVGGVTPNCTEVARELYEKIVKDVKTVSSPRVAEAEKLLENVFRSVNIALVNELAVLCKRMGIDIWEVIDAASTKPYGFMPFYPGPGLGGHCIPIDPYYWSWKAREYDFHAKFIELAGEINDNMPYYVVSLVQNALNDLGKSLRGSKILVLGVAYKKDIDDFRESPALKIIKALKEMGADVVYNDPYIPSVKIGDGMVESVEASDDILQESDCVLITTDHSVYDYNRIVEKARLVVDTRNATRCVKTRGAKIVKL